MSETVQSAPDKKELPKWDRSAEGVHNAVGRIASKLYDRVERVRHAGDGESRSTDYYGGSSHDAGRSFYTTDTKGDITTETVLASTDGEMHVLGETNRISMMRSHEVKGTTPEGQKELEITTRPDKVGATLSTEKDGLDESKISITSPAAVSDIAANALNTIRGQIAQDEQSAKQKMIDFANNKDVEK